MDNFSELQDGVTLCLILEAKHKGKKLVSVGLDYKIGSCTNVTYMLCTMF